MRNLVRYIFGLSIICGITSLIMMIGDIGDRMQNKYSMESAATSLLVFAVAVGLMVIAYKIPIKDNQSAGVK